LTSVTAFYSFDMADNTDALTVEGVFEKYASFAGLHGFEFEDSINTFDSSKWSTITGVTYGNTMNRTVGFSTDAIAWYTPKMPHSYVMEFTYHIPLWSVILRGDEALDTYYRLDYDSVDEIVTLMKITSGDITVLADKILSGQEIVEWGRVKLAVRDAQASSDSPLRTTYISLWINDNLIVTMCDNNAAPSLLQMGFLIHTGAVATMFSDFRVANLGEIITISSLDPGERPIGAIQRAIEDRYIKYWMRWNGKLKVWKPKARAVSLTMTRQRLFSLELVRDSRQIINHVRVLGAFHFVQVMDDGLIRQFGHRFRELQNTSAWNADDCFTIGNEMLIRSKEQAFQARLESFGLVLSEVEDRIKVVNTADTLVDYIIDGMGWSYENGSLRVSGSLRQYFYGEV
jgi:hypothetical protein